MLKKGLCRAHFTSLRMNKKKMTLVVVSRTPLRNNFASLKQLKTKWKQITAFSRCPKGTTIRTIQRDANRRHDVTVDQNYLSTKGLCENTGFILCNIVCCPPDGNYVRHS